MTINEPWVIATLGYESGILAPGVRHFGTGAYKVGHNLIRAHAESWHIYNDEFRGDQQGLFLF